mmetsp:Transcript_44743/g.88372  ORF Transcript_44743/g.88372 Transcript_44743/m.88372 type:complete len:117 (+) Transcript_44743:218-568(+)
MGGFVSFSFLSFLLKTKAGTETSSFQSGGSCLMLEGVKTRIDSAVTEGKGPIDGIIGGISLRSLNCVVDSKEEQERKKGEGSTHARPFVDYTYPQSKSDLEGDFEPFGSFQIPKSM